MTIGIRNAGMPPRKQMPRDWFVAGLGLAVLLAWIFPAPGARGGWLHPDALNKAGVSLVFFLHGLGLSFSALRSGALRWKLHLVVQCCTYLIFPILGLGAVALGGGGAPPGLALGFL